MSATINLFGPLEVPGAPQITAQDVDTQVNAALAANYAATGGGGPFLPLIGATLTNPLLLTFDNLDVPGNNSGVIIKWINDSVPGVGAVETAPLNIIARDYAGALSSIQALNVIVTSNSTQYAANHWPQVVCGSFTATKLGTSWTAGVHITAREENNNPSSVNAALTGMEIAHLANRDDDGGLPTNPGVRLGIHMSQAPQNVLPHWAATTTYNIGDIINPTGSAAVFIYICTVGGVSGSTQPTWPTSAGTVTDGSVTWSFDGYSCVLAMGYSLDGGANSITKSLFGVLGANTYQVFDARTAKAPADYSDPVAAVRMNAGQIIDFNGAATSTHAGWIGPAGSYLQYILSASNRLAWISGGQELFSVNDLGTLRITTPTPGPALVLSEESFISFTASENRNLLFTGIGGNRLSYTVGGSEVLGIADTGVFTVSAASFAATGSVATALSSVGPVGSHTAVQEWFLIRNSAGVVRYIPAF